MTAPPARAPGYQYENGCVAPVNAVGADRAVAAAADAGSDESVGSSLRRLLAWRGQWWSQRGTEVDPIAEAETAAADHYARC